MRKTRPQDYDPNFKQTKGPEPEEMDMGEVVPMKDRSPTAAAQQSVSMVDVRPERTERTERNERTERTERNERTEQTERDERNQRPVRSQKRQIIRHSFDIYIDQLEELRSLKVEAMRRGEERGLAKMTREALEEYLKRQR